MTSAETYARWVLAPENSFRTGQYIKLAAQRFISDLQREDIYFDEVEAIKMVAFAEGYCFQWEDRWEGLPVVLEPWQKFTFEQLFGWIRRDTETRRFTKFYVQISKKNGKSTMCAVLGLFHLFADERVKTPKVFVSANNEDQAKICVNMSGQIIKASPDLNAYWPESVKLSNYGSNYTEVIHKERNGFIKAMSKEGGDKKAKTSGGKHGINASLGLVDEFGMSPDHGSSGSVYTSMASRKERLMAYLTTAGFNMAGPCYRELRDQGIKVLEGTIVMDNYLPIIYEVDQPIGEDGKKEGITIQYLLDHPEVWEQSNPNIDISVNRDYLREMLINAQNLGGTTEVDVKTLNFNMWVDSPMVFIPAEVWAKNYHGLTFDDLKGQECYGGIELISGKVLNAFLFIFPDIKGKKAIKPIFWMPESAIKNNPEKFDGYQKWVDEGLIHVTSGNAVDNEFVFNLIYDEICEYQMHSCAVGPNLETFDILQGLLKNGVICETLAQGYGGISTPTKIWEELFTLGEVEHFNNPVLAWMNSNCLILRKGTDVRLERSGSKIAGISAGINALAQWKTVEANGINSDFVFSTL